EHREIISRLDLEDSRLGRDVDFKGAVPIEVIGRNVEYDRDLGVESTSGFELKAGNFKNDDRIWFGFRNQRNGRSSYISADGGGVAARSDDLAGESGCSSLAVRTSDSHDWSLQVRSEEHTSELQSRGHLVCRLLLEKKKIRTA